MVFVRALVGSRVCECGCLDGSDADAEDVCSLAAVVVVTVVDDFRRKYESTVLLGPVIVVSTDDNLVLVIAVEVGVEHWRPPQTVLKQLPLNEEEEEEDLYTTS